MHLYWKMRCCTNVNLLDSLLISTWLFKDTPDGNQAQSKSDEARCETQTQKLTTEKKSLY